MRRQRRSNALLKATESKAGAPVSWWPGQSGLSTAIGLGLVAITLIVFLPTCRNDFTNFDDDRYVTANRRAQEGLTAAGIVWALTSMDPPYWHPVTRLSHLLDCSLYGLRPAGHHLTSALLHAANVLLLFLVLRSMTRATWASAFVAAVFAIHPLRVESVAWIAERKDILSGLFGILTIGAYARYAQRPSIGRYLWVVLGLAFGLMSKPMVVTLPFVLLLLDYWPLGRWPLGRYVPFGQPVTPPVGVSAGRSPMPRPSAMRLIAEKIPLFILSAISSALTYIVEVNAPTHHVAILPLRISLGTALVSYAAYIGDTIFPIGLAVLYPYPPHGYPAWRVAGAALILAGVTVAALMSARKRPYLIVGWLWYLGTLAPVIGLVQAGAHARADRFTYLTTIGLSIMAAWGIGEALPRDRRWRAAAGAAAVVILALTIAACVQVCYWRNSITLFSHAVEVTTENFLAYNNLGVALHDAGKYGEAIQCFHEALRIKPQYADAHNSLGASLGAQGEFDEAIQQFKAALALVPDNKDSLAGLAGALLSQGKVEEAEQYYLWTVRVNPENANAHYNLGVMFMDKGDVDQAINHFSEAVRYEPGHAKARCNLAAMLRKKGRIGEAVEQYRVGLSLAQAAGDSALVSQIQQAMAQRE